MQLDFSPWYRWDDRASYPGFDYPGIYSVAITDENITGKPFSFRPDLVYIGMTNSRSGLNGRLWQFDLTISIKRCEHGGADRVLFKHQNYKKLCKRLYVAMWHVQCSPTSAKPSDLRLMGEVAKAEYECWARCMEEVGDLPEFNRKSASPKYTKRVKDF